MFCLSQQTYFHKYPKARYVSGLFRFCRVSDTMSKHWGSRAQAPADRPRPSTWRGASCALAETPTSIWNPYEQLFFGRPSGLEVCTGRTQEDRQRRGVCRLRRSWAGNCVFLGTWRACPGTACASSSKQGTLAPRIPRPLGRVRSEKGRSAALHDVAPRAGSLLARSRVVLDLHLF